ncbi:hypothetical protein [Tellurirhabdus bombi]|uniref:hypothetical protein n=1 Tax=Tellurirhabdus bombi TaxID=2907205 RepID=UPI001F3BE08A|nr:hypothetical protein [Tellurirhabdus bombi]
MKHFFWPLFLSLLLLQSSSWAQVQVSNVRVQPIDDTSLEILYDITGASPTDSVYFAVKQRNGSILYPRRKAVSGDYGKGITDGTNRRIRWNIFAEGFELTDEIQVTVHAWTSRLKRPGGPGYALLSALAPGIGNIFVQNPSPKIGVRPLLTVATYGLIIYGINQHRDSRKEYDLYLDQKNTTDAQPYYERANKAHQRYYIATRLAAVIWASDVVATFLKGARNQRQNRALAVRMDYQIGQPVAVVRYTF